MNAQSLENCLLVCFLGSWKTNVSCAVFNGLTYGYGLVIGSQGLWPRGLPRDGLLANGGTTSQAKGLLSEILLVTQ